MIDKKFLNILGFCAKTGNCIFGEGACLSAVRSKKAEMLLLDNSASENTHKRFFNACNNKSVLLVEFDAKEFDVAKSAGRPECKIIAIKDKAFAKQLISIYKESELLQKARME